MAILKRLARMLAPDLMDADQVRTLVAEEVRVARQALPMSLNYDPHNEGYRRYSQDSLVRRDLNPISQDLMIELAYYLYDTSGLVKRFVRDTKNFVLGEGVTLTVENDTEDGAAMQVLESFWNDSVNRLDMRLEKKIEFLGLLGEQCWPVWVNPVNGLVRLSYVDPSNIDDVVNSTMFPELAASVVLKDASGRTSKTLSVIREEWDPRLPTYGRLVGDCFFYSINNPPNASRGRSDLIQSFDFISAFEEGLFDEFERQRFMKSFIWDVVLQGATEEDIAKFLQNTPTPKPGSIRAHNERATWQAVTPDLKNQDSKAFFDFSRSYLAATQNRPDSWFGSGGKAYQHEADLMGEPTFKDLASRQRYVKYVIEDLCRFQLDQAVLKKALVEPSGERFMVKVNMPEMTNKNLKEIVGALLQLAQALMIGVTQRWLTDDTAATLFASIAQMVGVDIDVAEEIKQAAKNAVESEGLTADGVTRDYAVREALVKDILERLETKKQ